MSKKLRFYNFNIYFITIFLFSMFINIYCYKPSFGKEYIILQSTTSTQNSGLYDYILPQFIKKNGIDVRVVAVGTGQAIKNAQNCDGDVLLVHSRKREDQFVAGGYSKQRYDVMYNDFVIVGPNGDPAEIAKMNDSAYSL